MKISRIEIFPVRIPLKTPIEGVHGCIEFQHSILARVLTDTGEYGIGGIEPSFGYDEELPEEIVKTLEGPVAAGVVGENPFHIKKILEKMDQAVSGHLGSKSILEMALFDLVGRVLGVPVHVLFGGRVRDHIYMNGWVGLVGPDQARKEAREWMDRGFRSLKVKIDSNVTASRDRVEAIRCEVKDKLHIRVDANESLDMTKALETVKALESLNIFYLEQPFDRKSIEDFKLLSQHTSIRLMADESVKDLETLVKILKTQAAHFVKVKIQKMGGFLKTNQCVQVAESFGIPVVLGHGFGLSINTLAELHLAATSKAILEGCESVGPLKMADDVVQEPLRIDRGVVPVPDKPGIGIEFDEEKLKKYRVF